MTYLLYFCFIQVSLLLPSYAFIKKTGILKAPLGIQLCLSYVASLLIFAFFATIDYAFGFSSVLSRYTCWAFIVIGLLLFIRERYYLSLLKIRFPLLCLLAINIFSLAFISLHFNAPYKIIPDPTNLPSRNYSVLDVKILNVAQTNANDNYIPYRQAQFFVNRSDPAHDSFINEWGVSFFQRTPLMGAVVANYFNLLGDKPPVAYIWSTIAQDPSHTFIKFQIIAQVLNGLFILPAFFILIELFDRKTAAISMAFLITSQFFVYNAFFSWPKSLVAFFILTSWLLLLKRSAINTVLAGVVAGIAYLTHDLTSLYIGTSLVYLMLTKRFRDIALYLLPSFLLAAPWFWLTNLKYHKPSSFIYYPFSTHGIPDIDKSSTIFNQFFHTSPFTIIYIRVKSLFYLLSPYQLIFSQGGQALSRRLWAVGLYSVPGALGIGLIIPAYVSLVKLFKNYWRSCVFILMPVIFFVIITGWALSEVDGEGALHFGQAAIVIWSGLSIKWLLGLGRRFLLMFVYVLNSLQFAFFVSYSYVLKTSMWLERPRDILLLCIMTTVVCMGGWFVYRVAGDQKTTYFLG